MGGVVPVAEPVWSGVHLGLCLYAARVLAQDVWDGPVAVTAPSSPSLVRTALSSQELRRLESAVRKLSAFVSEVIARRATRRPLSQVDEFGRASLAVDAISVARRAQLEEAISRENHQTRLLRVFLNRTAQAIFLLRVLAEHNLPRLVVRGDPSLRDAVIKISFRCGGRESWGVVGKPMADARRHGSGDERAYDRYSVWWIACCSDASQPAISPAFRFLAGTGSRAKRANASRRNLWLPSYPST